MKRFTDEELSVLELDSLKLYYSEAKERLASIVGVEKTITERCYMLFAFYYALASTCIGYILSNLPRHDDWPMTEGCLVLFVFTCLSIYKVGITMLPHQFYSVGQEPKEVNLPQWVEYFKGTPKNLQYKRLISEEIITLQESIGKQQAINDKRAKQITDSLYLLTAGTVAAAICFLITYLLLS